LALPIFAAAAAIFVHVSEARALPSFARQTGQQCAACHNGFPELTPYGRLFKLNGYVFGGGTSEYPPLAAMVITSFTHTDADQLPSAGKFFGPNDNFAFDTASIFYGGAIVSNWGLGAFAQGTYDGIHRVFHWDNTDIRLSQTSNVFDAETVWGFSVNNNPTVQDLWNSTPAWGFPFVASGLAPTPAAKTLIESTLAQQVVGASAYTNWNRMVYLEAGGYKTLSSSAQSSLGVFSPSNSSIDGVAPYWRAALWHDWARNSLEGGVFGIIGNLVPQRMRGFGTDRSADVGIDTQYQFLSDRHSFSVQGSAIFESQDLGASSNPGLGFSANGHNSLQSYHLKGTYYYDQTYGATLALARIEGTSDTIQFANGKNNRPNSTALTAELDYLPFNRGGPDFWPWLNVKFGLQYVYYPEFNGLVGRAATNNNTLYLFAWLAF
jgi:hypothetical protein